MATIKAVLYTSKTLKTGEHPIMLRVIENRKSKYISLGFSAKKEHWDFKKERPNKKHPNQLELDMLLGKRIQEAQQVLLSSELNEEPVSAAKLLEEVKPKKVTLSFINYSLDYCNGLAAQGRIKTSTTYKESVRKLLKLTGVKELTFNQLNVPLLNKFEAELLKSGVSECSISVYMRAIRAIFNRGISEGIAKGIENPFKLYKISKLDTRTEKRAITKDQINKIINLSIEPSSRLEYTRKVFLFSYYCRGINFRDIALLKDENLQDNRLTYRRAKTGQTFTINLLPPAKSIIADMKLIPNTGGYLFPILNSFHDSPQRIENRLTKVIKQINSDLKEIAKLAGIPVNLTTYVARHSYATVLKRSGVSTSVISESMGHATEAITQTYLDSFENSVLDDADLALL